jgi:hypothetical protein
MHWHVVKVLVGAIKFFESLVLLDAVLGIFYSEYVVAVSDERR